MKMRCRTGTMFTNSMTSILTSMGNDSFTQSVIIAFHPPMPFQITDSLLHVFAHFFLSQFCFFCSMPPVRHAASSSTNLNQPCHKCFERNSSFSVHTHSDTQAQRVKQFAQNTCTNKLVAHAALVVSLSLEEPLPYRLISE